MRLGNLTGRAVLLVNGGALDVAEASDGRFGPDPMEVLDAWDAVRQWADGADTTAARPYDPADLGPPVPRPAQVFAVALNYRPHAAEAGYRDPASPLVFTKFPSCITGPQAAVELPAGNVDWELELVVVLGHPAHRLPAAQAWDVVAGVMVGQDLSERVLQLQGSPAQFSLGKSYPGFGPTGPALVSVDELDDPDDLPLLATLNGEPVQQARTGEMIFSVPRLIETLSAVCPLGAGDLIFTGTPAGVGNRRTPPRFLQHGDVLLSTIDGIGDLRNTFLLS